MSTRQTVRPAMVKIPGWAYARIRRVEAESVGARYPTRVLEIQITCGGCGKDWKATVEGTNAGELRHTGTGWESRCPHCQLLNVYVAE